MAFILSRLDSDLAKRNSFAHFSAFRPVAKIGDFLQLNSTSAQDSGEICEVSTTVDKDEENEISSKYLDYLCVNILYLLGYYLNSLFSDKDTTKSDEIIDVENEEKAKELKSEPQVLKHVL